MTNSPRTHEPRPRCGKCKKNDGRVWIGDMPFCVRCRAQIVEIAAARRTGRKRRTGTMLV